MRINNIEASIKVSGEIAPEYREKRSRQTPDRKSSCYIVSKRACFGFHIDFTHPSYHGKHVHTKYYVDGKCVARTSFEIYRKLNQHTQETSLCLLQDGRWEARSLYFAEIGECDSNDENVETRPEILKNLGTLKIKIWETEPARIHDPEDDTDHLQTPDDVNGDGESTASSSSSSSSSSDRIIPRKLPNNRTISHRTSLGRARILGDKTSRTKRKHGCLASFTFKYLSEDLLRERGILPPKPEPEPEKVKEKDDDEEEEDNDVKMEDEKDEEKDDDDEEDDDNEGKDDEKEQEEEYYLPSPSVDVVMRDRMGLPPVNSDDESEDEESSKVDGVKPLPVAEIFVDDWIDFP